MHFFVCNLGLLLYLLFSTKADSQYFLSHVKVSLIISWIPTNNINNEELILHPEVCVQPLAKGWRRVRWGKRGHNCVLIGELHRRGTSDIPIVSLFPFHLSSQGCRVLLYWLFPGEDDVCVFVFWVHVLHRESMTNLGVGLQSVFLCGRCAAESHGALRYVIERACGA